MKYRIIAPLLLVAAIGTLGWHGSRRMADARKKQATVIQEATGLGVLGDSAPVKHKAKEREEITTLPPGKTVHPEDLAFVREMYLKKEDRTLTAKEREEQFARLIDRFKAMSPGQIRGYIAEIRGREDLADLPKQMLIDLAVGTLADGNPPEGLALLFQLIQEIPGRPREHIVSQKVTEWVQRDAPAALAWVRGNLKEHGDLIPDEARSGLIRAIALKDRKEAFRLVGELEIDPPSNATQGIVLAAKTPEDQLAALADFREYLLTLKGSSDYARTAEYTFAAFGRGLAKDGFEAAAGWADSAGLTEKELIHFGGDLGSSVKDGDEGKWIAWLGEKLSGGKYDQGVRRIMMKWADDHHEAAGTWLTSAPASPVKNLAVSVFAERVAKAEPETAEQWALTLPEGKQRADTLHRIFHNWPEGDPEAKAAAAEFEKKHGIVHDH